MFPASSDARPHRKTIDESTIWHERSSPVWGERGPADPNGGRRPDPVPLSRTSGGRNSSITQRISAPERTNLSILEHGDDKKMSPGGVTRRGLRPASGGVARRGLR